MHAKAEHVTSLIEAKHRFGSNSGKRYIPGTVVSVRWDKSGQRANWFVKADFELPGGPAKRKELNIRSVFAGEVPDEHLMQIVAVQGQGAQRETGLLAEEADDGQPAEGAYSDSRNGPVDPKGVAEPGVYAHGTRWFDGDVMSPIGGRWPFGPWSLTTVTGVKLTAGCDRIGLSPFQYFMATFPTTQLTLVVVESNIQLEKKRNSAELLPGIEHAYIRMRNTRK